MFSFETILCLDRTFRENYRGLERMKKFVLFSPMENDTKRAKLWFSKLESGQIKTFLNALKIKFIRLHQEPIKSTDCVG